MVHATAQIADGVKLGADVEIGAYCVVAADVEIGDGTVLGPHVVVNGPTRIGRGNHIHAFASIGGDHAVGADRGVGAELDSRCDLRGSVNHQGLRSAHISSASATGLPSTVAWQ
jgi:acyl-[acyl carrier protein]--UDP-N-acetylglucosamine O-acyltransferase